ncbi:unnamed protein product [Urochloa humidicola]
MAWAHNTVIAQTSTTEGYLYLLPSQQLFSILIPLRSFSISLTHVTNPIGVRSQADSSKAPHQVGLEEQGQQEYRNTEAGAAPTSQCRRPSGY